MIKYLFPLFFFDRFCLVGKCGVTPHCSYRDSLSFRNLMHDTTQQIIRFQKYLLQITAALLKSSIAAKSEAADHKILKIFVLLSLYIALSLCLVKLHFVFASYVIVLNYVTFEEAISRGVQGYLPKYVQGSDKVMCSIELLLAQLKVQMI